MGLLSIKTAELNLGLDVHPQNAGIGTERALAFQADYESDYVSSHG